MKRSLRLCACVGVVLAVVVLTPAYTRADFVVSGNTFLAATQLDATDNWVLCNKLSDLSDGMVTAFVKGTDSPDFDSDPGLVVMYQLANNGGGNLDVKRLKQLTEYNKGVTSWGYFSGWGFKDGVNPIGLTENMGPEDTPAGEYRTGGTPGFTLVSGLVDPSTITLTTDDFIQWGFANGLTHEQDVSSLLVFTTSTASWDFKYEDISDINELELCWGLNGAGPEPATLGLLALGGLGALLRRRKSKA